MVEIVGVFSESSEGNFIPKRELLFFDKLAYEDLDCVIEVYKKQLREPPEYKEPIFLDMYKMYLSHGFAQLYYLKEKEIIYDPSQSIKDLKLDLNYEKKIEIGTLIQKYENIKKIRSPIMNKLSCFQTTIELKTLSHKIKEVEGDIQKFQESSNLLASYIERIISILLNSSSNIEACSIHSIPSTGQIHAIKFTNSDVIKLIIQEFPVIDESVPWDNIVQFRKENRDKLLTLRKWIYEVTRKGMSLKEANIELQYLMAEYQKAMSLYEMKYTRGKIETIVTATFEVLENLAKLKPSNVTKPFFDLKRQKMNLLEAEMSAPGREISYIVKAKEHFKRRI
jgi:hypothetical protein